MNYLFLLDDNQLVTICKYSINYRCENRYVDSFSSYCPAATYYPIATYFLKDNAKKSLAYFMISRISVDPRGHSRFNVVEIESNIINFRYYIDYYPMHATYGVKLEIAGYKDLQYYISHGKVSTKWY
jgi:hypothetical protein